MRFDSFRPKTTSLTRACILAIAACAPTARAQTAPATPPAPPAGPVDVAPLTPVQIMIQLGYPDTRQGFEAAFNSGNPPIIIAALNAAAFLHTDLFIKRAQPLLGAPNFPIQLAAGKYLGAVGIQEGADKVRSFAEAPREQMLINPELQFLTLDAAREVARHGRVDYAYQLPFLLEQGDWPVKDFAVQVLRDFDQADDPEVRFAWLTALSIYETAIAHSDIEMRKDAIPYAQGIIASALALKSVSTRVVEKFAALADLPSPDPDAPAPDFAKAIAHLNTLPIKDPQIECPPLDPDSRVVCQGAAEKFLLYLDKGAFDDLPGDLSDQGNFEGFSKVQWLEKIKFEYQPPSDFVETRLILRGVRSSQPTSYEVNIELDIDQYDAPTKKWTAMLYRLRCEWWGFNWHFTMFERLPNRVQPPALESYPIPEPNQEYPEAQALISQFAQGFIDANVATIAPLWSPDATYGAENQPNDEFLAQIAGNFDSYKEKIRFRPIAYRFTPSENQGAMRVEMDLYSYNLEINRLAAVTYHLDLVRLDGQWLIKHAKSEIAKVR